MALAERASPAQLVEERALILRNELLAAALDSVGEIVLVLNEQRQILWANRPALRAVSAASIEDVVGLRPGELFRCSRSADSDSDSGCGTAPGCSACGVARMIVQAAGVGTTAGEILMSVDGPIGQPQALEFRARVSRLTIEGRPLQILALSDVSAEKSRDALEQVFFHDVLNLIGGLAGWTRLLTRVVEGRAGKMAEQIAGLAERLRADVEAQRALRQGEAGTLEVQAERIHPDQILSSLEATLRGHEVAQGRELEVRSDGDLPDLVTDPGLLGRVLTNMLKNAFEASPPGTTVRVRALAEPRGGGVVFQVRNPTFIPPEVQHQIFIRYFSTKPGGGRGLGTYAMKLFGERYLGGSVWFTSHQDEGTCFCIRVPLDAPTRG